MTPLWTHFKELSSKVLDNPRVAWKEWGKFAFDSAFAAADITISEDKLAAVGANIANLAVAWGLRKRKGFIPFILPPLAYAVTRPVISYATGIRELKGGTKITQQIASEILVAESNKPVNPIKGHDAGHWGRETIFASGDFQPGSSWKGLWSSVSRFFGRIFGQRVKPLGFSVKEIRGLAHTASTMNPEQFAKHMGVKLDFLDPAIAEIGAFSVAPTKVGIKLGQATGMGAKQVAGIFKHLEQYGAKPGGIYVDKNVVEGLRYQLIEARQMVKQELLGSGITQTTIHKLPANLQQSTKRFYEHIPEMTGQTRADALKMVIFHEAAEAKNMAALASLSPKKLKTVFKQAGEGSAPGHYMSVVQEELFSRILHTKSLSNARMFNAQLRDVTDSWFSGFDDTYNTIEGLRHGGVASELRKILTDFGSGWIGQAIKRGTSWAKIGEATLTMRDSWTKIGGSAMATYQPIPKGISQGLGEHLKSLYETGGLQAVTKEIRQMNIVATEGRRFVLGKRLGEGSFKEVFEAYEIGKTARAGEKFVYAQARAGASETLTTTPFLRTSTAGAVEGAIGIPEAKKFVEGFQQSIQAHMAKFADNPLGAEVAVQISARKAYGKAVPEVIGTTERGFIQEHAGALLPESHIGKAYEAAQKHYDKVLQHSGTKIVHYDLHPGNVLRRGTKMSVIDWGLAAPTIVTPEIARTGKQLMDFYVKRQSTRFGVMKGPPDKTTPKMGRGVFSQAGTPEELLKQLEAKRLKTETDKMLALLAEQENMFVQEGVRRKSKLNKLQKSAQSVPFKLNATRRTSHGVDRTRRTK